jgi:type VI secretion system protein VasG
VIEEVKASPIPVILFIDEAHTMIGAGGQAGQGDAANLLKPARARGELRTIAATTWAEYKKYFERDAALARRFQVVKVEEPDEPQAIEMMRGLVATLEGHHRVRILQSALVDAVRLSNRYVSGRQLPDKAVSVLDTTCARIRLSQSSTPPAIEDCRRQIDQYGVLIGLLERESATGADHAEELAGMTERREQAQQRLAELEERWQQEKDLVQRIGGLRSRLEQSLEADKAKPAENAGAGDADASKQSKAKEKPAPDKTASEKTPPEKTPVLNEQQRAELRKELKSVEAQLRELQGETPPGPAFHSGEWSPTK